MPIFFGKLVENRVGDTMNFEVITMTQQQIVQEFKTYPKAQKSVIIRQLLQIFEEDLSDEENKNGNEKITPFKIKPVSLKPHKEFDFDNIGKLIEEIEGDFHK